MKLAISSHDCGNIFPQVDTIRIIVRQTSDKDKQLARQLGCLTNRAVEAMEDYITTLAPSSSSKVVRMKIPHYKCSITLDNGKNYEVSRSTGKHTNNLITLLDWISKNDPNFVQSRTLRLAPISQHEFYQSLVAASENNPESSKPCSVEMIEISPMAQLKLTGSAFDFVKEKIFGDLILDVVNQNQKHVKAIASHYRTIQLKRSRKIAAPLQPASSTPQPMDTGSNQPASLPCTCGILQQCKATRHMRLIFKK
jgi:hypothetical protein